MLPKVGQSWSCPSCGTINMSGSDACSDCGQRVRYSAELDRFATFALSQAETAMHGSSSEGDKTLRGISPPVPCQRRPEPPAQINEPSRPRSGNSNRTIGGHHTAAMVVGCCWIALSAFLLPVVPALVPFLFFNGVAFTVVAALAHRKNYSSWKLGLGAAAPGTLCFAACTIAICVHAIHGAAAYGGLLEAIILSLIAAATTGPWLSSIYFALRLAFAPALCPLCERRLEDNQWKSRRCPQCGSFANRSSCQEHVSPLA